MPKLAALMVGLFVLMVVQGYAQEVPYAVPLAVGQKVEIFLAKPYRTAEGVRVAATWTAPSGKPLLTLVEGAPEGTMTQATEQGRVRGLVISLDDTWLTLDLGDGQPALRIPRSAVVRWETLALTPEGAEGVPAGARVRIVSADFARRRLTGRLLAVDRQTLLLKVTNRAEPVRVSRSSVERLDVSRGRHGHAGTGAAIGALAIAPLGILAIPVGAGMSGNVGGAGALALLASAAYGAGIGALIGSQVVTERWDRVSLSIAVVPQARGAGAALCLRF